MTFFQSVNSIGEKLSISSLEDNMKSFLDWGFLNIGGFINVSVPTSGINGNGFHVLKPINDPSAPKNTIWETTRKDWIYETGISYSGSSPTPISGIYINNIFSPLPSGTTPYRINYPLGQIIFASGQNPNVNMHINYSYRYVQVYKASEAVWWKELQKLSYDPNFTNTNKSALITANHRIQMPAIVIETISRNSQIPYELGNVRNILSQDILLHVFTENIVQRNAIIDILLLQKDKETYLYDINKLVANNKQPLDYLGRANPDGLNYNQAVNNSTYRSRVFYIDNAVSTEFNTISSAIYNGIVRWTVKILP